MIVCHVANGNLGHAVRKLVFDASFAASVPHYMNGFGEAAPVTPLYYMGMRDHDNIDFAEFVKTNNTKRMLP